MYDNGCMERKLIMSIDLHIHTRESDGTYSPRGAVKAAKKYGLKAIGITDHDTIEGIEPAMAAGEELGIEVVPGIELNTDYGDWDVHILGYYMDIKDRGFLELLERLRDQRVQRIERFIERLETIGIRVSIERVEELAGRGSMGRPHLARALVEKGYANSVGDAFIRYLERGRPAFVERYPFEPKEAVDAILKAGGIPILAHPGFLNRDQIIYELVDNGLMGIEAYHSEHTREHTEHYLALAGDMGLLVTGGSDCHGPGVKDRIRMGTVEVPYKVLEELKKAR